MPYFPTVSEPSLFIRPIVSPRRQCGVTDLCPEAGLTGNVIFLGESSVFIRHCHLDRRLWDAICFPEKSGFRLVGSPRETQKRAYEHEGSNNVHWARKWFSWIDPKAFTTLCTQQSSSEFTQWLQKTTWTIV